jgi:endopolyphosphatase
MRDNWLLLLPLTLGSVVQSAVALQGRFLTLSDLHPDWHYRPNSSIARVCHAKKPQGHEDRAGLFGSPVSDCDSPPLLLDALFHELKTKWKDRLDFVVVMGDLAR